MSQFLLVLGLSVLASVSQAANDYSTLDNLLFKSFCDRTTVQSILGICFSCEDKPNNCDPSAASKDTNDFGTDIYSIASIGSVVWNPQSNTQTSSFTVATTTTTSVTCKAETTMTGLPNAANLKISPVKEGEESVSFPKNPTTGGGKKIYLTTGNFASGAVIVAEKINVEFTCNWKPA